MKRADQSTGPKTSRSASSKAGRCDDAAVYYLFLKCYESALRNRDREASRIVAALVGGSELTEEMVKCWLDLEQKVQERRARWRSTAHPAYSKRLRKAPGATR
ncbi:MAG: hypothetical protein J2P23_05165 [Microlunatus sp.]|nr:hypothetical protein [Microlunatus sp.]